jgi:hypothetical protein
MAFVLLETQVTSKEVAEEYPQFVDGAGVTSWCLRHLAASKFFFKVIFKINFPTPSEIMI